MGLTCCSGPLPWRAPRRLLGEWAVKDSNLRSLLTTDLQSVPFGHLGNRPQTGFPNSCSISLFGGWSLSFRPLSMRLSEPTTRIELVTARLQGGCSAD